MSDTPPRRAAIYARLSVDRDGKKVGIETQVEDSIKLASERGWNVVGQYIDRNLTAADRLVNRPQYDRMVTDFNAGLFTAVVCWDLDRLTRQPRQLEDWIDAAESKDVALVTANGEADLTLDGGRLYARVKVAVAKGEAERASARQKRSKQARRENGKWHGGTVPFGYRLKEGHLAPSDTEVTLLREAIRRILDDHEPMHSVVTDWNRKGIQTRSGKHWRQSNLRSILMNRTLLGETKAGVKGWDAIVDQRTFDRLQALLTDPSRKITHSPGVKTQRLAMGGGLTTCAKCGKPLVTNTKQRGETKQPTIACLARTNGPSESHPRVTRNVTRNGKAVEVEQDTGRVTIDHTALESYVFGKVIERVEATPRWHQRMGEVDPEVDAKIDQLEAERSDLRDQRDRAARAFVLGLMSERDAQSEAARIDVELAKFEATITDLLGRPVISKLLDDGIDWQEWTPGRRRAFLRLLIERVEVDEYPAGYARRLARFNSESDEDYAARVNTNRREVMGKRVNIVWR